MRKSYLFSFVAALSLAFVSIGVSDSAVAQVRASEPVSDASEMGGGGSATLLLLGSLVVVILLAAAASGGGDDERPVSP